MKDYSYHYKKIYESMRSLLKRKTLHYLLKFHHCFKKQKGSFLYKEKKNASESERERI